mmetsp:Transcript_34988/g.79781  ORF Transcript_34988/g.79781 Transcript_34988/m.79781 type:complete len:254 (-) Transcript_34988:376-1137(-)
MRRLSCNRGIPDSENQISAHRRLVEHAALVGRDHIFDVDEGILSTVQLQELQGLLNQVADVHPLALIVHNGIADVHVFVLEDVEHRQNLSVVRDQSFANHLTTQHQLLQHLQNDRDNGWIAGVECGLDWNDQLRDDRKNLGATVLQHVEDALYREETVWLLLFPQAVKEDGQVVVVVQLLDVNFPLNAIPHSTMLNGNRQVAALVKPPKLRVGGVASLSERTSPRRQNVFDFLSTSRQRGTRTTRCVLVHWIP